MTAAAPLVTIGMPTYNRASLLRRAIESVRAQDYENLDIVISDNGSSDDTEATCRAFAAAESRIRYFRQAANLGANFNFRFVVAEARGDYFMWLGDDDWLDPRYVSRCAGVLAGAQSYGLVAGTDNYDDTARLGKDLNLEENDPAKRVVSYFKNVGMNGTFYGVMRRSLIEQVPITNRLGGDWLILASMAFLGRIKTLRDVAVHRSTRGVSTSWDSLAALFGHTGFKKDYPYLAIAASVFTDVAWESPVYARLGRPRRWALAIEAAYTVARRHYSRRLALRIARDFAVSLVRR